MPGSSKDFYLLLNKAREGDEAAKGRLLDMNRPALQNAAEQELGDRMRVRTAPSDLVQLTMLSATRNFDAFAGEDFAALYAWMQRIQARNLQDCLRYNVQAECRSVNREIALENSDMAPREFEAAGCPQPYQQALDREKFAGLHEAVLQLPDDQCTAVSMRHLEDKKLEDIAIAMGKSKTAVASLITRGLRNLRTKMGPNDSQIGV